MDLHLKEILYTEINQAIDSLENREINNTLQILEQIRLNIQNNKY